MFRLNSQVKEVQELRRLSTNAPSPPPTEKEEKQVEEKRECPDLLDMVHECRRARVREQCARLQPRVVLSDKVKLFYFRSSSFFQTGSKLAGSNGWNRWTFSCCSDQNFEVQKLGE